MRKKGKKEVLADFVKEFSPIGLPMLLLKIQSSVASIT